MSGASPRFGLVCDRIATNLPSLASPNKKSPTIMPFSYCTSIGAGDERARQQFDSIPPPRDPDTEAEPSTAGSQSIEIAHMKRKQLLEEIRMSEFEGSRARPIVINCEDDESLGTNSIQSPVCPPFSPKRTRILILKPLLADMAASNSSTAPISPRKPKFAGVVFTQEV